MTQLHQRPQHIPNPLASGEPGAIAFTDPERSISFEQARSAVELLCVQMADIPGIPGKRVGILAENSIEYALTILALQQLGSSAVLLNTRLLEKDWQQQLANAGCEVLLCDSTHMSTSLDIRVLCLESLFNQSGDTQSPHELDSLPADRESVVIFTSGSSGHTKGIKLSSGNFHASASASNRITKLGVGDSWLVSLPLYHLGGLGILFRTLYAGATSHFIPSFNDELLAQHINAFPITHLSLVPTQLELLLARTELPVIKRLKAILLAGAPSSERLLARIAEDELPVLSAYGMTETTAHCCCMRLADPIERVHSVGKAFDNTEIEIVDEQDLALPSGSVGEIRFRGPTVCLGYLNSEQKLPLQKGWLYSGDLGKFDEDGYLYIVGRKDDMFISGGENIHPGEIEQAALRHQDVHAAAVIAIPHPTWGKRPILFVEPKVSQELAEEDVLNYLRQELARIKVPDRCLVLEKMPLTAIGKNDYQKLLRDYQSALHRHTD